jgi:hypothetical protein
MNNQGSGCIARDQLLARDLGAYIEDFVDDGDQMVFIEFGNTISPVRDFRGAGSVAAAVNYLNTTYLDNVVDANATRFCDPSSGPDILARFSEISVDPNNPPRSAIVVGDGQFSTTTACSGGLSLAEYVSAMRSYGTQNFSPNFTIRAVGINPSGGLSNLELVGEVGGGGYESWIVNDQACCDDPDNC